MSDAGGRRSSALPVLAAVLCGSVLIAVNSGVRTSFGLFTLPVTADLQLTREAWGFAMALQNLVWGLAQPFAGEIAERIGTARTMVAGLLIYAVGVVLMAYSPDAFAMDLTGGVICGVGIAVSSISVVMAAFGRIVPPEKRTIYYGIATSASSFGQFVFAPISQGFIGAFGWQTALLCLALTLVLVIPLTAAVAGKSDSPAGQKTLAFGAALATAWSHPSYRLLVFGFFVCGFHVAFITVHLPAYLVQCGLPPEVGSWSLALLGLLNIAGALFTGYLGGRVPKQMVLASIYLLRAIAIAIFLLMPPSALSAYLFAGFMGVLWLSTVPPTAGLVTTFFGPRYMGMLYGIVFLSHQIGGFIGVWLGGVVFDQTGSYALMWYLSILLGLLAAALHLPIRDASARLLGTAAAS